MEQVDTPIEVTMNWNPSYSYSTLPAGYSAQTLPSHWKTMRQPVKPAEKGIPWFRNIFISGIKVSQARQALSAAGLKESRLENFTLRWELELVAF
jgi:hypothetical protein